MSPELQRLGAVLEGSWATTVKYERGPSGAGGTGSGKETVRRGPGDQSLIIETTSTGPNGEFSGLGVITWSKRESAYKLHWFTNLSPYASEFTGVWSGESIIFNGREWVGETELSSRHAISNIADGAFDYAIDMGPSATELMRTTTMRYRRVGR